MVDSELDRSILMNSMDFLYSLKNSFTSSSPPPSPPPSSPAASAAFLDRPNSMPNAVLPMMSMAMHSESWQKGMQSWSGHPAMLSTRASTYDCIVGMSPASLAGWYSGITMFLIDDHVESLTPPKYFRQRNQAFAFSDSTGILGTGKQSFYFFIFF
uniref:Uncharacterized protein n=1 Tax=Oryza meridionalis TaxID=40149 RepID=A0A0E0CI39_9ORYZ